MLTGVTVTDRQLGVGSWAAVLEVEHNGQKYAGKIIYDALLDEINAGADLVHRFAEEESGLLSQLHHPNIVQFVGFFFRQENRLPILVMELLSTNLGACIEEYGVLPKDIGYSILHDVALGLHYLHSRTPPIVHRNLTARDILLTSKMSAKICGFVTARGLHINPITMASRQTHCPVAVAYMPPEVLSDYPTYNTSIDVFSYGIVMIFMFSGNYPGDLKPVYTEKGYLSEAERREKYLQAIGKDHPAMEFILKCITNDPQQRPTAIEIPQQIKRICQYDGKCSVAHNTRVSFRIFIKGRGGGKSNNC